MCRIHHYLFRYLEWEVVTTTEISKGGQLFLPYRKIEDVSAEVFDQLHKDSFLRELDITDFAYKAAYYLGRVNMIHPFREGNGRVQRIFLDQLAELSGYAFQWSGVSGEGMAAACREARQKTPVYTKLEQTSGDMYYPAVVSVPPPLRDRSSLFGGAMLCVVRASGSQSGDFGDGAGPRSQGVV